MIQLNKLFYDEKISKQSNLFDIKDETKSEKFIFDNNSVWESKELLNEEFKSLGLYFRPPIK